METAYVLYYMMEDSCKFKYLFLNVHPRLLCACIQVANLLRWSTDVSVFEFSVSQWIIDFTAAEKWHRILPYTGNHGAFAQVYHPLHAEIQNAPKFGMKRQRSEEGIKRVPSRIGCSEV